MRRWKWIKLKDGEGRLGLQCGCGEQLFAVVHEPVARKVKSRNASRKRTVAECLICNAVKRIALGSSS